MPSCAKPRSRPCQRSAWLRRVTGLLCTASLAANLCYWERAQALPGEVLLLQGLALLAVLGLLRQRRRAISLLPEELAQRMLMVQEGERQHLSRELHDDIGQLLTAATLQLDWLQRRLPGELKPHALTLRGTLEQTLTHVRDVTCLLNPRQLLSLGLEASLRAHLLRTLQASPVRWTLHCPQRLDGVPTAISMAAFRITQEAVTNLLRHAHASNLHIELRRSDAGLLLRIEDDGVGFTPGADPQLLGQRGLAGMQERAQALQGTFSLSSQPGHGTRIEARLPWPPRSHPRARTPVSHGL
ncbi:sensor histidine kinase [Pseudomonas cremoricolorata]|uniref:sensor histidine kinase n=1 Tax=Pseudomonas cremoricolorata TaxID=157783 RepID=UPI00048C62C0|nr:sensor histidine kinase [Pseudomonas cremoricolorata]